MKEQKCMNEKISNFTAFARMKILFLKFLLMMAKIFFSIFLDHIYVVYNVS